MIELNYAQPMWPRVAYLLDESSKIFQFCTSSRVTWTASVRLSSSCLTLVYVWTNWRGLFTWIELLSCWPSLVPGLTCLQKDLQLLTKPTVTAYPPNESMLLLVSPDIKSYPSVESIENVCWAKHQTQSILKGCGDAVYWTLAAVYLFSKFHPLSFIRFQKRTRLYRAQLYELYVARYL